MHKLQSGLGCLAVWPGKIGPVLQLQLATHVKVQC